MKWIPIKEKEADAWNEQLKNTNASFFQYPYYAAGYWHFLFSKPVYLRLEDATDNIGFCCIMQIGFWFLKLGLVMRGPVFFLQTDIKEALTALKQFAKEQHYILLRINPNDAITEKVLEDDNSFMQKDFFPVYKGSQHKDLVVYKKPESELLHSFRDDCRSKIRFQHEMDYTYKKINTAAELKEVYDLFSNLGKQKSFNYRPVKSYSTVFFGGNKYGLCDVYTASLKNKLVCAAFIVKEGTRYTYFSGALVLDDIKPKYSPANNLHYLIMQDCFYKDDKQEYNLSYSPPGSGVHMFKTSFKPVEEDKPLFYTYVIKQGLANTLLNLQKSNLKNAKNRLRKLLYFFKSR